MPGAQICLAGSRPYPGWSRRWLGVLEGWVLQWPVAWLGMVILRIWPAPGGPPRPLTETYKLPSGAERHPGGEVQPARDQRAAAALDLHHLAGIRRGSSPALDRHLQGVQRAALIEGQAQARIAASESHNVMATNSVRSLSPRRSR